MPFVPIDDSAPRMVIGRPWVTWGFIGFTVLVFWGQLALGPQGAEALALSFGVIPATVEGYKVLPPELYWVDPWVTLLTYPFLHAGFWHIVGNLLYLWVFGDNVEDAMGHWRFFFYLICGALAGLAHVIAVPTSEAPVIGASGAVSAILGAYLILHPRAKVLVPIVFIPLYLPSWLLLIVWFAYQFHELALQGPTAHTAWWAHIGGFIAGLVFIFFFRYRAVPLFGRSDPPGGITLRDRQRWESAKDPSKSDS